MAPEVAAVERKGGYNQLCDIWACGITAIGEFFFFFKQEICSEKKIVFPLCIKYRISWTAAADVWFASDASVIFDVQEWL